MTTSSKSGNLNKLFSGGLGTRGKIAAWAVAFGAVGAWKYYENRNNGETFSKDEQEKWNKSKKGADSK
eukprot:CAMPEP_0119014598 /NCGR_PEP_ID=MMETSP1176-20130426/10033_1 /TAXON_ID=265551 /ORGANISM="Synedropsis recta cf, Strain CCMP1620" /LENGTH=67 /DNA_ID=CAMNT_0006967801 /DNA_START=97 /DNA_END=300 /DNA_ORIENTATION=+